MTDSFNDKSHELTFLYFLFQFEFTKLLFVKLRCDIE